MLSMLAFDAPLGNYVKQARELLDGHRAGASWAIDLFKRIEDGEIAAAALNEADAELAVARWYCFADWAALAEYNRAVHESGSAVRRFEYAVEAVVAGDATGLAALLSSDPALVHARSTRRNHFDPTAHRATLLHYVAANGVESFRQKTPPNAVELARMLLTAGAEADALASFYGAECSTMDLLVSSTHPARAGLQTALIEVLVEFGASLEGAGDRRWGGPVLTALGFGFPDAAATLARLGARVDSIEAAAGLGDSAAVAHLLAEASPEQRHRALCLASQLGQADALRLLLDAGEDPNRYNPDGLHSHSTPLHQASISGHLAVAELLLEKGARLDLKDKIYQSTPLGWAEHGGRSAMAELLRRRGGR